MRSHRRRQTRIARRLATGTVAAAVSIGGLAGSAIVDGSEHVPWGGNGDHVPLGDAGDHVPGDAGDHGHHSRPLADGLPRIFRVPVVARPPLLPHSGWVGPTVEPAHPPISEEYGVPGDWQAGHHTGVDFAVPSGTPLQSVGPGKVTLAGIAGAYGNAVTVHMKDGKYVLFAHLSKISVRVGQWVKARTSIGESGNSGRTTGPHLHFEVRTHRGYGSDIDPVAYLARRGVRMF